MKIKEQVVNWFGTLYELRDDGNYYRAYDLFDIGFMIFLITLYIFFVVIGIIGIRYLILTYL